MAVILTGPDTQKLVLSASYKWLITLADTDLTGVTITKIQAHFKPVNPDHTAFTKNSTDDSDWLAIVSATLWTFNILIPLSPSDIPTGDSVWQVEFSAEDATRRWIYDLGSWSFVTPKTGLFS